MNVFRLDFPLFDTFSSTGNDPITAVSVGVIFPTHHTNVVKCLSALAQWSV